MGLHKGIPIPDHLVELIDYMKSLEESRDSLSVLGQQWDLLAILSKMTATGTDMNGTREDFNNLTSQLLGTLGIETLKKSVLSISSKAQVTVDIVIRNLFERTADIGFLATDNDIRRFLLSNGKSPSEENIKNRFAEYVAKYSVYNNIILLDTDGNIKCQLSNDNPITKSDDNLIQESIQTQQEYVETHRWTDLNKKDKNTLVYSYKVCESNAQNSKVLGVLCLVFRFENEMEGIFKNLKSQNDWTVLSLLDSDGKVIASSDKSQVSVDLQMDLALDEEFKVIRFGGILYLAKTYPTKGYQGFTGLGWYGHAMIPLAFAFERSTSNPVEQYDHNMIEAVTNNPTIFSDHLRNIPIAADVIQSELDRTVWNGNLVGHEQTENNSSSVARKVLLSEISTTGNKTKKVFEDSINNLHGTVVTSIIEDAAFVSYLAIDIMDRNLYERANDCRWWALTSAFREILSKPSFADEDAKEITKILEYINGLYTVYTNLIIFDKSGKILAISNPSENHVIRENLSESFVRDTLSLQTSQDYSVSPFDQSKLYNQDYTYVYSAAIRSTDESNIAVGGIGIVFDSTPEFKAMLEDSLPRDSNGIIPEGCFGIYADREKNIISSTKPDYKTGEKISIDDCYFNYDCGEGHSQIIEFEGKYYALGVHTSKGYREYKSENSAYQNDVISLAFILLGNAKSESIINRTNTRKKLSISHKVKSSNETYKEIASFHIGECWIGVDAKHIISAINVESITKAPGHSEGIIIYEDEPIGVIQADQELGTRYSNHSEKKLIVLIKTDNSKVGIIVDGLGEICEVEEEKLIREHRLTQNQNSYVEAIIQPLDEHSDMLIILDPISFVKTITDKNGDKNEEILGQKNKVA